MSKIIQLSVILVALLCLVPGGASAQEDYSPYDAERPRDQPRGEIQITNDWRDAVTVTMWTHRRERIGDSWALEPGESAYLAVDNDRIKVRPNYKIKVGNDWGWVNLGEVGEFRRGAWQVNVRDIWRATHQRRGYRDDRSDGNPDWR